METGIQVNQFSHELFVSSIVKFKEKFLSLSEDSIIGQLGVFSGRFEKNFLLRPIKSDSVSFKKELELVAYGSKNKVLIWDTKTEAIKNIFYGHANTVFLVDISRDGQFAISCPRDSIENLIYWNLMTARKVAIFEGHTSSVFCACFSFDGLSAASGSADLTVRTWDLKEARQDCVFEGHTGYPYSIKFFDKKNC